MRDLELISDGPLSTLCRNINLSNFNEICQYIAHLPYKRNIEKLNISCVMLESCGTCSTKHVFLKKLAEENSIHDIELWVSIIQMDGLLFPSIKNHLCDVNEDFIPEAHAYLKMNDLIYDFTMARPVDFLSKILESKLFASFDFTILKNQYHKNFLYRWCANNNKVFEEIWTLREKCIQLLS